jgi:hypothetical protein
LKIVEEDSSQAFNNIKGPESNANENTFQIVELPQESKDKDKVSEDIDFDAMEFEE